MKPHLTAKAFRHCMLMALTLSVLLVLPSVSAAADLTEKDVYRGFGYMPMKDGVRLAYVIWLPSKAGRYPVVLHYSPYGSNAAPFREVSRFLEAGYAYLGVNMRGTGCSEGIDLEGGSARAITVGRDGAEVVEWAAAQPWSIGSIGMIGNSYAGGLQLATAANRPPHLKAITSSGISASDYREGVMPGGMVHLGGMAAWTLDVQPSIAQPAEQARIAAGDTQCKAILAKQRPVRAYWEESQHPLRDGWWKERDAEEYADQITVPTLIMMGWQDEWNLNAGTHLFKLLKSPHKKILLQNGGHGVGAPELRGYQMDHVAAMRWLDRWVKGEENGADRDPAVTVLWEVNAPVADGSHAAPGWTTTYPFWPPPQQQRLTLYLTDDGRLSPILPASGKHEGIRSYLYPAGTELVGNNQQFALAPYPLGSLSYRTDAMTRDMTILGLPQLTFFFSSEQKDTDFMFTLKDVDPAGNTLFLQKAFLRAWLRHIDQSKSTADEIIQSFDKPEELVPGQVYEIKLSIPAIGHVVRKGHRLELSILAPSPIPAPVMGGVPLGLPSINKVFHLPPHVSTLVLPIVPGETAQSAAPQCGSLQLQPCRAAPTVP